MSQLFQLNAALFMDVAHLAHLLAFLSAPAEQTTSASQCRPLTWQQNLDDVTSSFSSDVAPPPPAAGALPVWEPAQWKDLRLELIGRRFEADLCSHEQKEEVVASVFSCPLAYLSSCCCVSMRATPVPGWLVTPNGFALSKGIWYTANSSFQLERVWKPAWKQIC